MDEGSQPPQALPDFQGTEDATVDEKGRVLISKAKRDGLGQNFVIALSEVGAVALYPKVVWDQMRQVLEKVSMFHPGRQTYVRLVYATAVPNCNCDPQGRVVIPGNLRDEAHLFTKAKDGDTGNGDNRVKVTGAFEKVEIWAWAERVKYMNNPTGYGAERREAINKAMEAMLSS